MAVDPQVQFVLDLVEKAGYPSFHELSPADARAMFDDTAPKLDIRPENVFRWEQRSIPGPEGEIPVRVYVPREAAAGELLPVLVYYHGGGFVIGSLDSYDSLCRAIANRADCIVVSVDYRLAPEHKFPAAVDDCCAALDWVEAMAEELGGDPDRIAIGGDSAGGNLAAVTAINARDNDGPPLVLQVLIYPVLGGAPETASHHDFAVGYLLTRKNILWFYDHYLNDEAELSDPRFAPLLADDLSGLPPTLLIVAGYDPLCDEGLAYGARLKEAGVTVDLARYPGMTHGFVTMSDPIDKGKEAIDQIARALRQAFTVNGG